MKNEINIKNRRDNINWTNLRKSLDLIYNLCYNMRGNIDNRGGRIYSNSNLKRCIVNLWFHQPRSIRKIGLLKQYKPNTWLPNRKKERNYRENSIIEQGLRHILKLLIDTINLKWKTINHSSHPLNIVIFENH